MPDTSRKEIAETFLKAAATANVREAYDRYTTPSFRHHNPYFKGDRESLLRAQEENSRQFPDKRLEIKMILEEGDKVVILSRVQLDSESPEYALVHIFRFENNKVAELWDIGQEIPEDSPNANGMF